jgi:hypothetical protein
MEADVAIAPLWRMAEAFDLPERSVMWVIVVSMERDQSEI